MSTSNVLIRADGNSQIGLGHLVRSVSLALMLEDTRLITFYSKEAPQTIQSDLKSRGFHFCNIKDDDDFMNRISADSVVILDGYNFDLTYQRKVKETGATLVCIDDVFDREFVADLIINHAPGIKKEHYKARPYTTFALGPEYALLRPAFLDAAQNKNITPTKDTLLICFGGADIQNKTKVALEAALNFNVFKKIIIITGSAYSYLDELVPMAENHDIIEHYHSAGETEMVRLMSESETAIVPASGILFEVLAAGNTVISGTYTDNQQQVYYGFKKLGAILDAKHFKPDDINSALLQKKDFKTKRLIDGKSPERIRNLFKNL